MEPSKKWPLGYFFAALLLKMLWERGLDASVVRLTSHPTPEIATRRMNKEAQLVCVHSPSIKRFDIVSIESYEQMVRIRSNTGYLRRRSLEEFNTASNYIDPATTCSFLLL